MADLTSVDQHNIVACLERTDGNTEFHQIVDFLTTSLIHYALTISLTIYASYIEQFWATTKSKTVNDVKQIHATVDGMTVVISESSVRSDLLFNDEDGTVTPLFASMLVPQVVEGEGSGQPSKPQPPSSTAPPSHEEQVTNVGDEDVYTREDDRVVRAATTATSFEAEQESGNINKTRSTTTLNEPSPQGTSSGSGPKFQDTTLRDADAQTRFQTASKQSHNPPLSEVNTSRSREDNMEHQDDLTDFIPPTPHDLPLLGGHTPRSDEGRNLKTMLMFEEGDFDDIDDMVDEAMENVEGDIVNAGGAVNTATTGVSAASASVTNRMHEEEIVELEKRRSEITAAEETSKAAINQELDDIQAMIEADEQMASRLQSEEQEQFTIKEKSRMLVEMIAERKRFFAIQRAAEQRTYKQVNSIVPMDSEVVKDSQKKDDSSSKQAGRKEQIVQDEDRAINYETLAVKSPIVDWVSTTGKQDLFDIHRLVMKSFGSIAPKGYDLILWGVLKTMIEPNEEDEVWRNQQE
nr:hypothetical protein [Tanacetum cinerariifolium]